MAADFAAGLAGYVEVSERLVQFYATWPDGRVVAAPPELVTTPEGVRVAVTAYVYRCADDQRAHLPAGIASSWEVLPGLTPYTKHAEAENAETSAIGRALVAAGVPSKRGLASADEVRTKQGHDQGEQVHRGEAKGQLLAACAGSTDRAGRLWQSFWPDDPDFVPATELATAERVALAAATPADTPDRSPAVIRAENEATRAELVARARDDVAAAAAAHNEGKKP
jgi:hypothetical protein